MQEWLYGRNPVYETLRSGRRQSFRLLVAEGAQPKGRLGEILQLCKDRKVPVERPPRSRLDAIAPAHQGVALKPRVPIYRAARHPGMGRRAPRTPVHPAAGRPAGPQNLGTLLRTADAVGVHGAVIPLRHTAEVTPAVVVPSSGACEHLLVAQANLAQAITLAQGGWRLGGRSGKRPSRLPAGSGAAGWRIGAGGGQRGQGLRPLVRDSCDVLLRLPMRGQVASLNAAVAGSLALYMAWEAGDIYNLCIF